MQQVPALRRLLGGGQGDNSAAVVGELVEEDEILHGRNVVLDPYVNVYTQSALLQNTVATVRGTLRHTFL